MRRFLVLFLLLCLFPAIAWPTASDFNGTTSRLAVSHTSAIAASAFTMGCWTYRESDGENSLGRIWDKNLAHAFTTQSTTYEFAAHGWNTTDGLWTIAKPAVNEWHYIAIAYNTAATTNDPNIFVDGVLQTATETQTPAGTYADGSGDLIIGDRSDALRSWDGRLASCFYYNRMLTATEVKQIMRCGPPSLGNGLVGYWPMGVFGGRNYTSTTGLTGTETAITVSATGPPVSAPQGGLCD